MSTYSEEDMKAMFDQSNVIGIKQKGKKGKETIIRWDQIDYAAITALQAHKNLFDRPHIMRFIIQSKHPELLEDLKAGKFKKKMDLETTPPPPVPKPPKKPIVDEEAEILEELDRYCGSRNG